MKTKKQEQKIPQTHSPWKLKKKNPIHAKHLDLTLDN